MGAKTTQEERSVSRTCQNSISNNGNWILINPPIITSSHPSISVVAVSSHCNLLPLLHFIVSCLSHNLSWLMTLLFRQLTRVLSRVFRFNNEHVIQRKFHCLLFCCALMRRWWWWTRRRRNCGRVTSLLLLLCLRAINKLITRDRSKDPLRSIDSRNCWKFNAIHTTLHQWTISSSLHPPPPHECAGIYIISND